MPPCFGPSARADPARTQAATNTSANPRFDTALSSPRVDARLAAAVPGQFNRYRVGRQALALAPLAAVKQQHRDDDGAVDDLAAGLFHLDDGQDRLQESDQNDARDRADVLA